ncbi:MAG: hypothetical protein KC550_01435 [Nanoarchaeota archaeon]|nr:hypothetical protein [Nanoarchaeota archaeon]
MKKNFQQNFNTITNILIIFVLFTGSIVWADSNGVWLKAEDVRAGELGADEGGGDFGFGANVRISNDIDIGGNGLVRNDLTVLGNLNVNLSMNVSNINVRNGICFAGNCYTDFVKPSQTCGLNKSVVGFTAAGEVICDYPFARYR